MERLTKKYDVIKRTTASVGETEYVVKEDKFSKAIKKLGELEDVLESWHIENLEELKIRLHDCQVYHLVNNSNETLIHNLKNELSDLQHRLEVAEKALELACEELMGDLEFNGELDKHYNLQANIEYFKTKAKEMLKSE